MSQPPSGVSLQDGQRQGTHALDFTDVFGEYQRPIYNYLLRMTQNQAEAEDLTQESFIRVHRYLPTFRGESSLETYLFAILRRRIADHFRGRRMNVCLLQDLFGGADDGRAVPAFEQIPSPEQTASHYVRRDEQRHLQRAALAEALQDLVARFRESLNFRELEVFEMLFFCRLGNKDAARIAGLTAGRVGLIKHRCLERLRGRLAGRSAANAAAPDCETMLTEVWESLRPSCPKRSTIGAYLLDTLEPAWRGYVDFHLNRLGCRFCLANLEDLKKRSSPDERKALRQRIMQSTVGWLRRP